MEVVDSCALFCVAADVVVDVLDVCEGCEADIFWHPGVIVVGEGEFDIKDDVEEHLFRFPYCC